MTFFSNEINDFLREQNVKTANTLKLHMTNCLYSIEEYKSNI